MTAVSERWRGTARELNRGVLRTRKKWWRRRRMRQAAAIEGEVQTEIGRVNES